MRELGIEEIHHRSSTKRKIEIQKRKKVTYSNKIEANALTSPATSIWVYVPSAKKKKKKKKTCVFHI